MAASGRYATHILTELRRPAAYESLTEERRAALERLVTAGAMTLPESYLHDLATAFGLDEGED